jgi:glycosyltransferase involved in cell wall biosynthesis
VIVSDDHSQDSTYLVGLGYQQESDLPITLIRQPTNLGYGGNQKAGTDWPSSTASTSW